MKRHPVRLTVPFALLLPLIACGHAHDDAAATGHEHGAASEHVAQPGQALACGCSLPAVVHCSEWAEVDGEFVELVLPATSGLGAMPFCGKSGLRAELEGELVDGKYVVTNFRYVP